MLILVVVVVLQACRIPLDTYYELDDTLTCLMYCYLSLIRDEIFVADEASCLEHWLHWGRSIR